MATEKDAASGDAQTYTLYFIRHAEALHNQLEKEAQAVALSLAVSQGHGPDSSHAKQVQEEARQAILQNDNIEDPPISELGKEEARGAKKNLEHLIKAHCLPPVEEVWVSPLQRSMQTAATIFPEDGSGKRPTIRAKKEIQERLTGLACDTHSSYAKVRKRMTFRQFSLSSMKLDDDQTPEPGNRDVPDSIGEGEELEEKSCSDNLATIEKLQAKPAAHVPEDKAMLRERTKKLFDLLASTESRSIALIGHKGYLRELERGPLGYEDAELFKNCEVRVYRLQLDVDDVDGSSTKLIDCEGNVEVDRPQDGPSIVQRSSSGISSAEKVASSIDIM